MAGQHTLHSFSSCRRAALQHTALFRAVMWCFVVVRLKTVIPMQTAMPGTLSDSQILLFAPFPTSHPGDLVTIRKIILFLCRLFTMEAYLILLKMNPAQWSSEKETGPWHGPSWWIGCVPPGWWVLSSQWQSPLGMSDNLEIRKSWNTTSSPG